MRNTFGYTNSEDESSARSYGISGADTENGKLTFSSKNAPAGRTVTVTVTPDEGYELRSIIITDAKGNRIALEKVNDTTYTFRMPASGVAAEAEFALAGKCPQDETCPMSKITREQLAVILYNYAKFKGIDVSVDENTNFLSFNDFWDTSEWAKPAMMWAIDRELIAGDNWDLKPQGDAVRVQAATIIWKFCETIAK